jgi:mersacidin/lichenicidin family type 2 lantibiotic
MDGHQGSVSTLLQKEVKSVSKLDIIRAWKDLEYQLTLSEAERALLPAHSADLIALTNAEMAAIAGGIEHGCTDPPLPRGRSLSRAATPARVMAELTRYSDALVTPIVAEGYAPNSGWAAAAHPVAVAGDGGTS